jgi:hypothetical protein
MLVRRLRREADRHQRNAYAREHGLLLFATRP